MKSTKSFAILVVVVCHVVSPQFVSGQGSSSGSGSGSGSGLGYFCDPDDYTQSPNPPIPALPEQYSTIIEANLGLDGYSFLASEHYDYPGNRGRLVFRDTISEQREMVIYDYDDDEVFLIPDLERGIPCGVQSLSEPSGFVSHTFGITYVNGSVHIAPVSEVFDLAVNEASKYVGVESVRGIPCHHWQTCHDLNYASYLLDFYFVTTDNWTYYFSGETIPVQITSTGYESYDNGLLTFFDNTYSFVGFHSGPSAVPDSVFEVPAGLPCLGRTAGKPLPNLPPYFSLMIESVESPTNVGTFREFYDTQLFRIDVFFNGTPYSIIHDFDLVVQYVVDTRQSKCYVSSLENVTDFYDVMRGENGEFLQKSPTDFLRFGSGYNFSYEGETRVRGIDAEAWISIRDNYPLTINSALVNGTVELFYSRPGVDISSLYSSTSAPIPLAINMTGTIVNHSCTNETWCAPTEFSAFYNFYSFSSDEPDFDVFDTSPCATPGEYEILSLIIPGQESGSALSQLRKSVRLGLTEWADIPKLQVGNIQIVGENGTHIFVTLQILPIPSVARYSSPRTPQDILDQILDSTSSDDELPFEIQLPSGDSVRPFLLRVDPDCPEIAADPTITASTATVEKTTATVASSFAPTPAVSSSTVGNITTNTPSPPVSSSSSTPPISTKPPTNPSSTSTSQGTNDCPTASSSGSSGGGGVSGGTVAGISIAMFTLGMICALFLVLLIRCCCRKRRRTFNLTTSKYRIQENEMEGFTD